MEGTKANYPSLATLRPVYKVSVKSQKGAVPPEPMDALKDSPKMVCNQLPAEGKGQHQ